MADSFSEIDFWYDGNFREKQKSMREIQEAISTLKRNKVKGLENSCSSCMKSVLPKGDNLRLALLLALIFSGDTITRIKNKELSC